jgi:hypothetical protein
VGRLGLEQMYIFGLTTLNMGRLKDEDCCRMCDSRMEVLTTPLDNVRNPGIVALYVSAGRNL